MKPKLEKIEPEFGTSFKVRRYSEGQMCNRPSWHFHPEYEIVYISNGKGKRHIGDHISYYENGDLIFLGPNLPHFGFTEELHEEHVEVVVQMKEDFLGADFLQRPEMAPILRLFAKARQGLSFHGETKRRVGELLIGLSGQRPLDRILYLLQVLRILAESEEYRLLNVGDLTVEVHAQDQERMTAIYQFVEQHFQRSIALPEVAGEVNMTVPAFCRYFKKLSGKTFTRFVNEFRIAQACRLMTDGQRSIANIGFDCGFNNLSHFNRQFKLVTGSSPSAYRKELEALVGVDV